MPLTPEMLAQIADRQSNIGADLDHHERSRRRTVVKRGTEIFEGGDYPHTFDEFVGQAEAKTQLRTAIASAQARGAPLDHVLLASGAQGIGKTTLAQIIAAELGVGLVSVSGAMTVNDARTILLQMRPGDVLFWDEFHLAVSGNRNRADWMLPLLTDSVLMTKNAVEEMPHITVVAATTDVGRLPATITSRFMIRPEIVYYTNDEGIALTYNLAARMGVDVDNGVVRVIAQASNNNPRDMRMILTAYRDLCATGNCDIETALRWAGVTSDGLPRVCQDVMLVLLQATDYTLSLDTVQAALGEPGPLRYAEQLLIQKGYLTITGRGRKLTPEGADRARGLIGKETR